MCVSLPQSTLYFTLSIAFPWVTTVNYYLLQARTRSLILGGLLKSVEMNATDGRNVSASSSMSTFQELHMTVGQVSRDFSTDSRVGHNRADTVAFLVGKTFELWIHSFPDLLLFLVFILSNVILFKSRLHCGLNWPSLSCLVVGSLPFTKPIVQFSFFSLVKIAMLWGKVCWYTCIYFFVTQTRSVLLGWSLWCQEKASEWDFSISYRVYLHSTITLSSTLQWVLFTSTPVILQIYS